MDTLVTTPLSRAGANGVLAAYLLAVAIALLIAYDAGLHRGVHRGFRLGFTAARKLFTRRGTMRYVSRRASHFTVDSDHQDAIDRG